MSGQYQERERREYLKQYREKNKDRLQQKRHDYYGENKDRIKEWAKQWKQDHSSMVCVPKQEYFEKNKDKINESRRRKCAENKEQINQKKKEYRKAQKPKNISVWNNFPLCVRVYNTSGFKHPLFSVARNSIES